MKVCFLRIFFVLGSLFVSQLLHASLAVDKMIVDFASDSSELNDVQLINNSETETLFINIEVLEVNNPGAKNESRISVDDPTKVGLIATPNRLILPAGSRRNIRLVNLFPADHEERVFRVNITPTPGESDEQIEGGSLRIMVGYQILVIVRPNSTDFNLVGERKGDTLKLTNNSNTNVYLSRINQCPDSESEDCEYFAENRLYPGILGNYN